MAVTKVTERWSGRPATGTWDSRECIREFEVSTDNPHDDFTIIATAKDPDSGLEIPSQTSTYPTDQYMRVTNKRVDPIGPCLWKVTCQYQAFFPQGGYTPIKTGEPTEYPPDVEWGFLGGMDELKCDKNGKAFLDAAGERIAGTKVEWQDQVLRITRNEKEFNAVLAREYAGGPGAVNSDVFLGAEAGTVKCQSITGRWTTWNGYSFWRVTYEFIHRDKLTDLTDEGLKKLDPWKERAVSESMYCISEGLKMRCRDDKNNESVTPQLIDSISGAQLAFGAKAQYIEIDTHPRLPFAVFNLSIPK